MVCLTFGPETASGCSLSDRDLGLAGLRRLDVRVTGRLEDTPITTQIRCVLQLAPDSITRRFVPNSRQTSLTSQACQSRSVRRLCCYTVVFSYITT
jgi:hypothetical protein